MSSEKGTLSNDSGVNEETEEHYSDCPQENVHSGRDGGVKR